MPTLILNLKCYVCGRELQEHSESEAKFCREQVHERIHGKRGLHNQQEWLYAIELTTKEPNRIGTQCCKKCRCFLPGKWGTVGRSSGNVCGQCAREEVHDCYANAVHIVIPGSRMGDPTEDFWQCKMCERKITVDEFLK